MSFMPTLKTPVGIPRRENRTGPSTRETTTNTRPVGSHVRFNSNLSSNKRPILLDQIERERRKREALDFLRRETKDKRVSSHGVRTTRTTLPSSNRIPPERTYKNTENPESLKTYELLGEKPISYVPSSSRSSVYNDQTIRNITKDSYRKYPFEYNSRISDKKSRISKPSSSSAQTFRNNTLLNSLSNFGSKVFRSILYSEQDTNPIESSSRASFSSLGSMGSNDQFWKAEIKQKEIDLQVAERKKYLDELNRKIKQTENQIVSESPATKSLSIDKQIEKLDERLQNILENVQSSSSEKVLQQMESIKNELTTLRRKQESNNMKFESKFEDMKLENQLNRQKFDRLFNELEDKRRELDLEKDALIQKLRNIDKKRSDNVVKNVNFNKDYYNEFQNLPIYEDKSDYEDEKNSKDDIYDRDDRDDGDNRDDENVDILKYIVKNRRKSPGIDTRNMTNRIKQIKSNLKKIDDATKRI